MTNDIIVQITVKDSKGIERQFIINGNMLLCIEGDLYLFRSVGDTEGLKYRLSDYYSFSVVGKYNNEGKECEHYSIIVDELLEKRDV